MLPNKQIILKVAHGNSHDWKADVFSQMKDIFQNIDIISLNEPYKQQIQTILNNPYFNAKFTFFSKKNQGNIQGVKLLIKNKPDQYSIAELQNQDYANCYQASQINWFKTLMQYSIFTQLTTKTNKRILVCTVYIPCGGTEQDRKDLGFEDQQKQKFKLDLQQFFFGFFRKLSKKFDDFIVASDLNKDYDKWSQNQRSILGLKSFQAANKFKTHQKLSKTKTYQAKEIDYICSSGIIREHQYLVTDVDRRNKNLKIGDHKLIKAKVALGVDKRFKVYKQSAMFEEKIKACKQGIKEILKQMPKFRFQNCFIHPSTPIDIRCKLKMRKNSSQVKKSSMQYQDWKKFIIKMKACINGYEALYKEKPQIVFMKHTLKTDSSTQYEYKYKFQKMMKQSGANRQKISNLKQLVQDSEIRSLILNEIKFI